MNVRDGFLYDAEDRCLELPGKPRKIRGDFEFRLNAAALNEAANEPMQSIAQARFIQQRRMEQIGECPRLFNHLVRQTNAFCQPLIQTRSDLLLDSVLQRFQIHIQSREDLPRAVVQLASKPAAFVILHLQQPGREAPQALLGFVEFFGMLLNTIHKELPLGHVPGDFRKAEDIAGLIAKWRNHDIGPKSGTIFPDAPAFAFVMPFLARNL